MALYLFAEQMWTIMVSYDNKTRFIQYNGE